MLRILCRHFCHNADGRGEEGAGRGDGGTRGKGDLHFDSLQARPQEMFCLITWQNCISQFFEKLMQLFSNYLIEYMKY